MFDGDQLADRNQRLAGVALSTGMTLEAWVNPSVVTDNWRDVIYKGNDNYFLEATSQHGSRPAVGGTFGSTGVEISADVGPDGKHLGRYLLRPNL